MESQRPVGRNRSRRGSEAKEREVKESEGKGASEISFGRDVSVSQSFGRVPKIVTMPSRQNIFSRIFNWLEMNVEEIEYEFMNPTGLNEQYRLLFGAYMNSSGDENARNKLKKFLEVADLSCMDLNIAFKELGEKTLLINFALEGDSEFFASIVNRFVELDSVDLLLNALTVSDREGKTPLHHFVLRGDIKSLELISKKIGLNHFYKLINLEDNAGHRPLHYATVKGDIEIIKLFKEILLLLKLEKMNEVELVALLEGNDPEDNAIKNIIKEGSQGFIDFLGLITDKLFEKGDLSGMSTLLTLLLFLKSELSSDKLKDVLANNKFILIKLAEARNKFPEARQLMDRVIFNLLETYNIPEQGNELFHLLKIKDEETGKTFLHFLCESDSLKLLEQLKEIMGVINLSALSVIPDKENKVLIDPGCSNNDAENFIITMQKTELIPAYVEAISVLSDFGERHNIIGLDYCILHCELDILKALINNNKLDLFDVLSYVVEEGIIEELKFTVFSVVMRSKDAELLKSIIGRFQKSGKLSQFFELLVFENDEVISPIAHFLTVEDSSMLEMLGDTLMEFNERQLLFKILQGPYVNGRTSIEMAFIVGNSRAIRSILIYGYSEYDKFKILRESAFEYLDNRKLLFSMVSSVFSLQDLNSEREVKFMNDFLKECFEISSKDSLEGDLEVTEDGYFNFLAIQSRMNQLQSRDRFDLNFKKLFHDPERMYWDVIDMPDAGVDDVMWGSLESKLGNIVNVLYSGNAGSVMSFFSKTMQSKDVESDLGMQLMRKRVAGVVGYLVELTQEEGLSEEEKSKAVSRAKKILNIVADGGEECPDRVVAMLGRVENYIKIYKSDKKYAMNVLIQMFKENVIESQLANYVDAESVEAYLYYCLKYNESLGLGMKTGDMLYEDFLRKTIGVMKPQGAVPKIFSALTVEDLVGFVSMQPEFRELFENEFRDYTFLVKEEVDEALEKVQMDRDREMSVQLQELLDAGNSNRIKEMAIHSDAEINKLLLDINDLIMKGNTAEAVRLLVKNGMDEELAQTEVMCPNGVSRMIFEILIKENDQDLMGLENPGMLDAIMKLRELEVNAWGNRRAINELIKSVPGLRDTQRVFERIRLNQDSGREWSMMIDGESVRFYSEKEEEVDLKLSEFLGDKFFKKKANEELVSSGFLLDRAEVEEVKEREVKEQEGNP